MCVDFDVVGVLRSGGRTVVSLSPHHTFVIGSVLSVLYLEKCPNERFHWSWILLTFKFKPICAKVEKRETWMHRRGLACYIGPGIPPQT